MATRHTCIKTMGADQDEGLQLSPVSGLWWASLISKSNMGGEHPKSTCSLETSKGQPREERVKGLWGLMLLLL